MDANTINYIFTGISFICVLVSIEGAIKSLKHAKTARLIAERDDLKEILEIFDDVHKYIGNIRKLLNPINQQKGVNPIKKISSNANDIQNCLENLIKNIPPDYNNCLKDYSSMKKIIGELILESNLKFIDNKRLNYIEEYFDIVRKDIKELYTSKTKELSKKK